MPRSTLAYLADIVGACEAIARFLDGVEYAAYRGAELTRSAVERQLILIGEAVHALLRLEPSLADRISHARRIVDFRNQLAHDYAAVNRCRRLGDRNARGAGAAPGMRSAPGRAGSGR